MLLSRVADSLYWIGRYLERAEQIARSLDSPEEQARALVAMASSAASASAAGDRFPRRAARQPISSARTWRPGRLSRPGSTCRNHR